MGWDDYDFNDPMEDLDYFEYMNRTGMYEDNGTDEDPEDDIYMAGLDPNDLEFMDEDARRQALEDAGLDPFDYDDYFSSGYSSGRTRTLSTTSHANTPGSTNGKVIIRKDGSIRSVGAANNDRTTPTYSRSTPSYDKKTKSNGKWSVLEFIAVMTVIYIIALIFKAIGGELLGAIVVIILGVLVMKYL